jgi:UDP-N-acetylglucosamine kinase
MGILILQHCTLIFNPTGGQPGAGKSSIIDMIEERFNTNIVVLNGDEFKPYYPGYNQLLKIDPDNASRIVQEYSNYVVDEMKQALMKQRYNLIIEGTMRNSDTPINTAKLAKENGYIVEACVIATNYYASRIGCIKRYELDKFDSGVGRSVPVASHDEAYNNIPNTLQQLIASKQFENILIYSRYGEIVADYAKGDNIVGIYKDYRQKITPRLYKEVNQLIDDTRSLKSSRNSSNVELVELEKMREALSKEFQEQQINDQNLTLDQLLPVKAKAYILFCGPAI